MTTTKWQRGLGATSVVVVLAVLGTLGYGTASAAPGPTPAPPTPSAPATPTATPPAPAPAAVLKPGQSGKQVRVLQARLRQLGWFPGSVTGRYTNKTVAAVKNFQARRSLPRTGVVDATTWNRLNRSTRTPSKGELANKHGKTVWTGARLDARCRTVSTLCIDKRSRTLRWVVGGEVRKTLQVRFGASGTPTREGVFHVGRKSRDHVSNLYGSSMPFAMFFSGGQAVHYSSDFAARGYSGASHGCVNVRDYKGLKALFDQVKTGDKVVVYWS